jgi:sugar lactone lactonase YvrE
MRRIAIALGAGVVAVLALPGAASAFGPVTSFGGVSHPQGVAATSSTVYVADSSNGRVASFSLDGSSQAPLTPLTGSIAPQDVASGGPLAGVYAASPNRFDGWTAGANLCNASQPGSSYGVAVDGSGTAYASDTQAGVINRYNASVAVCVPAGNVPGQLAGPQGLAFAGGSLYVAEPGNGRVLKVDPASGGVQQVFAMPTYTIVAGGKTINGRIQPHDVAVDGAGRVIVPDPDPRANLVAVLGPDGGLQQVFGSPASDPGNQCAVSAPWGVGVSGSRLYLSSTGEDRIRIFDDAAAPCPAVNFGPGGGIRVPGGPDRKRPKIKLKGLPKKCARRNFTLKVRASDDVQLRRFILLVNRRKVANQAVNKQIWNVRVNFPVRRVRSQLPPGTSVRILVEVRVKDTAGKRARVKRSFRICG